MSTNAETICDPSELRASDVSRLPGARPAEFERFLEHAGREIGDEPTSLRDWVDMAEAWKIRSALRECEGNRSAAARALGIGRRTLYAKMEKLRITPSWGVDE